MAKVAVVLHSGAVLTFDECELRDFERGLKERGHLSFGLEENKDILRANGFTALSPHSKSPMIPKEAILMMFEIQ